MPDQAGVKFEAKMLTVLTVDDKMASSPRPYYIVSY